jgi:hypothetical protein
LEFRALVIGGGRTRLDVFGHHSLQ